MHTLQKSRLPWHHQSAIYFLLDILWSIVSLLVVYEINPDQTTVDTLTVWWVTLFFFWQASASPLRFFSQSYRHPVRLIASVAIVSLVYFFVLRADYSIVSLFLVSIIWVSGALWLRFFLHKIRPILRIIGHPLVLDKLDNNTSFKKISSQNPSEINLGSFDYVVFDPEFNYSVDWKNFFVHLSTAGIPVFSISELQELIYGKVPVELLQESWIEQSFVVNRFYLKLKRFLDVYITILCLPILLVLSFFVALAIKIFMGGSVVFKQKRVGLAGNEFVIYKFRTMENNKNSNLTETLGTTDPRITQLGRILRLFRLDELPQFYNILRGEMSLIGPRPEWLETAKEFSQEIPLYQLRHIVRPGLTGWAQVQQGHTIGITGNYEKLRFDLFYIKHCSIWLDLKIILLTLKIILFGKGV